MIIWGNCYNVIITNIIITTDNCNKNINLGYFIFKTVCLKQK